jgi:hypothetical protein
MVSSVCSCRARLPRVAFELLKLFEHRTPAGGTASSESVAALAAEKTLDGRQKHFLFRRSVLPFHREPRAPGTSFGRNAAQALLSLPKI